MYKKILPVLLICGFLTSCEDDIGVNVGTEPGLFVTWELLSETVDCPEQNPITNRPQDEVLLVFRRGDVFRTILNGETTLEGSTVFNDDRIFFTPSPFPNNFTSEVTWVFNGAQLVLNSEEFKFAGSTETCSVRRVYQLHSRFE